MIESLATDLQQYHVYHSSIAPLVQYSKTHGSLVYDDDEIKKLIPYARQTDFILSTFTEIADDLNYDKEKFESIIYNLDDDYDILKEFISKLKPKLKNHNELYKISDKILNNLMKVQNVLGLIILEHEHNKI